MPFERGPKMPKQLGIVGLCIWGVTLHASPRLNEGFTLAFESLHIVLKTVCTFQRQCAHFTFHIVDFEVLVMRVFLRRL